MARQLAKRIGYVYVDTGAMYRAVTLYALRRGFLKADGSVDADALEKELDSLDITFSLSPQTGCPDTCLNGEVVESEIRQMEVSSHVSVIAALPFVREALVRQQQKMGQQKGIVMDGRDIGTTVFPHAELKIFVKASPSVRARRRYDELKAKGVEADYNEILKNVEERDYIDSHREVSPLRQAPDALVLDNSYLTIEEQNKWLYEQYERKLKELSD